MNFLQKARLLQWIIVSLFIIFLAWWLIGILFFDTPSGGLVWGNSYQLVALAGAIGGIIVSKNFFYGTKSSTLMEQSILSFSVGLLFQVFGQSIFGIYNSVFHIDVPYPSLADIGFFGSIIFYTLALILLAKITGIKVNLKSIWQKTYALLVPILILCVSFLVFLPEYSFDWNHPIKTFLDLGYPLIEAVLVSITLTILLFAKDLVGGIIKWPPLLMAMLVQYIADFNFTYQTENGTWVNSAYGDVLYLLAYFLLSIALIQLGVTFHRLITENKEYAESLLAEE